MELWFIIDDFPILEFGPIIDLAATKQPSAIKDVL